MQLLYKVRDCLNIEIDGGEYEIKSDIVSAGVRRASFLFFEESDSRGQRVG